MNDRVFIVAEAGVNHNGDLRLALQLVDTAAAAGADAVKVQTFRADRIISRSAPKAEYQIRTTTRDESQFDMIRKLELDDDAHEALIARCRERGIGFLSTPFDVESLRLLTGRFGLTTVKIASGEITNAPLLLEIARATSSAILSTGMSTLGEVEAALGVLAFGFTDGRSSTPRAGDFGRAFASQEGRAALRGRVTLLHCTTEYPAPFADINLRAMDALSAAFGLPVGYSDHSRGIHITLAAVARGARVVEKHFTLNRSMPGPDHRASLEPNELTALVEQVRNIEVALGDGIKGPAISEQPNRAVVRKSLVAARPIRAGERFSKENVACKRPGTGLSPANYWDMLGRTAERDYSTDDLLDA